MAGMSWLKPPAVVVVGGTEDFLRDREIHNAVRVTAQSNRAVIQASSNSEAVDALTAAATFGAACLVVLDAKLVEARTVTSQIANQPHKTCLLLVVDGLLDEKKLPVIDLVSAGYRIAHVKPTTKKGLVELAIRFSQVEAANLLDNKQALDSKLAEAFVNAVGSDLGIISQELVKITAYSRSEGKNTITPEHVKALIRPSSDADMGPLREAMKTKNRVKVAAALDKIRRVAQDDPVMLLLRAKGGPADLALTWLRAALLLEKGVEAAEIASRISAPEWAVTRDIIPAARTWGSKSLRRLIGRFAEVDRGVLKGSPAPWVSFEAALLLECLD